MSELASKDKHPLKEAIEFQIGMIGLAQQTGEMNFSSQPLKDWTHF
jgi:hypothetical protein